MPLQDGASEASISANIKELIDAGHSKDQAAAIAYKKAGKYHEKHNPKVKKSLLYIKL